MMDIIIEQGGGRPFSVSVAQATATVSDVKLAICRNKGFSPGCQHILHMNIGELDDYQPLQGLFVDNDVDEKRRLYLHLDIVDSDVTSLFALMQALTHGDNSDKGLVVLRGWRELRREMTIQQVRALVLEGVTFADERVVEINLSEVSDCLKGEHIHMGKITT